MKKTIILTLAVLILLFGFSAWVFATPVGECSVEQEKIKQIAWHALDAKYEIHTEDIARGQTHFAVKDDKGVIGKWRELKGDVSVYVYGDVEMDGKVRSYYAFYSLALKQVVSCEIR